MLVANPGHTPYSFTSKTSKIQSSNQTNKSSSNKNSNDALTNSLSSSILLNQQKPSTSSTLLATTTAAIASTSSSSSLRDKPSTSFDVIKTHSSSLKYNDVINSISVRINRGTELIKQTVNKALFSKITPAFGGLLTVPPTSIHKSPDRNTKSTDSLKLEMCHFKPIKTVPTTPNKKTKIIIRTPKAKRAQKIDFPRSLPIKSAVSLLLSSQNSAFYLVKRSKDIIRYTNVQPTASNQTNSTAVLSKDNDKKLKRTDTINLLPNKTCPINTTTCQRLKRNRNESHSPSSSSSTTANTIDAKRICLDINNTRTTRTTRKSSNLTNNSSSTNTNIITDSNTIANNDNSNNRKRDDNDDKPNGLIVENGQRRSIRIRNKKLKNDLNLNDDTYTINNINNNNTSNCNLKNFKTITNNINSNVNLKTNSTLFHIMTRNKSIFNVQKKSEPIIEIKHSYRKCVKKSSTDDNKMNSSNSNNNNNINVNRNNENKNSKTKKKKQTNNNTNKRKNNKSNNTRILTAKSKLSLLEKVEKTNDKQQKQIILSNNDRRRTRQQNQQNKKSPTTSSSSSKSSSSSLLTDKKTSRKSNRITNNNNNNTVTTRGESVRNLRPRVQK